MATGNIPSSYRRMLVSVLDNQLSDFIVKSKSYVDAVKHHIETHEDETVDGVFQAALRFLGQPQPDIDGTATSKQDGDKVISDLQKEVETLKVDMKNINKLNQRKQERSKKMQEKHSRQIKELEKVVEERTKEHKAALVLIDDNLAKIRGFVSRNLKASPSSSQAAAIAKPTPPKSGRENKVFEADSTSNSITPIINDAVILENSLVVVADLENTTIKVFDVEGNLCQERPTQVWPRLCKLSTNTVAVTHTDLEVSHKLDIINISRDALSVERSISTERCYPCITAISPTLLAAGHLRSDSIDILDTTSGRVIKTLDSPVCPWFMCLSTQGTLVISGSGSGEIAEMNHHTGQVITKLKVPGVDDSCGLAVSKDGSTLVIDGGSNSLSLLAPDLKSVVRRVWKAGRHHLDATGDDHMWTVSVCGDVCVCFSRRGMVTVMEFTY